MPGLSAAIWECSVLGLAFLQAYGDALQVDCTAEVQLCRDNVVSGFPSIRVFRKGSDEVKFGGGKLGFYRLLSVLLILLQESRSEKEWVKPLIVLLLKHSISLSQTPSLLIGRGYTR